MLNRDNLRDFIPEDGTYKGVARISFRAPDGEVTGPGTIRVSPDGHVVVRVDVETSVDDAHSEAIWCMPLFGSLSEFERCANACFVNEQTPYIHFDSDGHACGVLVFPPMDESSDREFSAVIFGEIGGRAHGTL